MKRILVTLGLVLALIGPAQSMAWKPARAQMITDGWINVVDPVLNPSGLHVIARHYKLYDGRANCAIGQTARLIVAFHGGRGSSQGMTEMLAPQGCYVIAYPSGSTKEFGVIRVNGERLSWNTSSPYEQGQGWAGENGVKDDLFIGLLVAKLKTDYGLTTAFAAGISRGGMMAYHLACDTTLFAAIATVATTVSEPLVSCPNAHIPSIHVHGDDDGLVCWETMRSTCEPWPVAKPRVAWWQNTGIHELHLVPNGTHRWQPDGSFDTTGKVLAFFNAR